MATKKSTSKKRQSEWWEPFADHAGRLIARAAGEIVGRIISHTSDRLPKRIPAAAAPQPKAKAAPRKPRLPPAWWKVLEVSSDATAREIKTAYRKLMAQTHPYKVSHLSVKLQKAAEKEAKKLNAALDEAMKGKK